MHEAIHDPRIERCFRKCQVTTRRTQGAEKALVPKWSDPVSRLPGVGKETINKLKDLHLAGLRTPVQNYKILTGWTGIIH